jgi:hypothetical protein
MRKRRRAPSFAVREAETALVRALENVVRGIERLQNEVRESVSFLESLARRDVGPAQRILIEGQLKRMRKDWPELFKPRGKD